jgi:hypothetical protein
MIFEAARLCYDSSWMPTDPQIVSDSPKLFLRAETLQLVIDHVEACLKAASPTSSFFGSRLDLMRAGGRIRLASNQISAPRLAYTSDRLAAANLSCD